ncbi:MAG: hypothetical protein GY714_17490 [Desulfobacterales bacterium]|nr:hypothetical protein [Desulfobacterales bacterium]MCP4162864.1 hypothetical protein [Deltaproteobacteria bacterium]
MNVLEEIKEIISEVLDIEKGEIAEESYLIRELDAESVDFLEMALSFSEVFGFEVQDDFIFLRNFQEYMAEAEENGLNINSLLCKKYEFLSSYRVDEMLSDIKSGNIIKIKDLVSYINFYKK